MKKNSWKKKLLIYLITHATLFASIYTLGVRHAEDTRKVYYRIAEGENTEQGFNKNPYGIKLKYERNGDGKLQVFIKYTDRDNPKRQINPDLTCGTAEENLEAITERSSNASQKELQQILKKLAELRRRVQADRYNNKPIEQGYADIEDIVYTVNADDKIEVHYKIKGKLYPLKEQPSLVDQSKKALRDLSDFVLSD